MQMLLDGVATMSCHSGGGMKWQQCGFRELSCVIEVHITRAHAKVRYIMVLNSAILYQGNSALEYHTACNQPSS